MFFRRSIQRCKIFVCAVIFIFTLFCTVQAYNLNVERANIFNYPYKTKQHRPSYFGFSVALYNSPNFKDQSVLVGAPRANTTRLSSDEPGTVYKCNLGSECIEWNLDRTSNEKFDNGIISRHKSWLGASISVENGDNPKIMVCSPRWKIKSRFEIHMTGICYQSQTNAQTSFDKFPIKKIMPIKENDWLNFDNYKYGMASLGFSLNTFSNKGQWYEVVGAPGADLLYGKPFLLYQKNSRIEYFVSDDVDDTHQYLGYSVTSGKYFESDEIQYAAGAPGMINMEGSVLVYVDDPIRRIRHEVDVLRGMQIGAYFGASLTSCDIDNDGKDEIIVGAPMWTNKGDEGSVYIFTTRNTKKFNLSSKINGNVEDARFGLSVMCLGDLDHDGYQDIAIGAPYENGHGAIYIYNGNKNGLALKKSQRVAGDEFSYNLQGFGISISQPRDIDGNGYFDVAVGAYQSDHAVVLRSQPVVIVNLNFLPSHTKINNNAISFSLQICGDYKGKRAPNSLNTIIRLEIDAAHERAYMSDLKREHRTYSLPTILFLRKNNCQNLSVSLKERNANVIDPIEISASLIFDSPLNSSPKLKDFFFNYPIINEDMSKNKDKITLEFAIDCGDDNVCDSYITLDMMTNLEDANSFMTGSTNAIKLFINIHNYGEAAYETQVHVFIPESLALLNNPVNCKQNWSWIIQEIICSIGNPLRFETNFTLELVMKKARSIKNHVQILANITTRSNNLNFDENTKNLTIHFVDNIDITVSGNAHETSYSTYDNEKKEVLESINFQHIYRVRKFGVTPIMQSNLIVSIPTHIIDHEKKKEIEIAAINQKNISLHEITDGQNSHCIQVHNNTAYKKSKYLEVDGNRNNSILYIDCTNPIIICSIISCFFDTSLNSYIIGDVSITMELKLKNLKDTVMNDTSIITFMSHAHIRITSPTDIIQKPDNRPDHIQVETIFNSSTVMASQHILIWIIALSVFVGILLLALFTYGLIKVGFFNRKNKEELETLKSDEVVSNKTK